MRKIIDVGKSSKGVIIPKSWLDVLEKQHGSIEAVYMEVNGKLTIRPILKEDQRNEKKEQKTDNKSE